MRQQQDGVNGAALNLLNQVQQYGYATLEQAEGHRAEADGVPGFLTGAALPIPCPFRHGVPSKASRS
ncbi:MAG: hypothetical protein ACLSHC_00035 [Bilophila wadsworthia]